MKYQVVSPTVGYFIKEECFKLRDKLAEVKISLSLSVILDLVKQYIYFKTNAIINPKLNDSFEQYVHQNFKNCSSITIITTIDEIFSDRVNAITRNFYFKEGDSYYVKVSIDDNDGNYLLKTELQIDYKACLLSSVHDD